MEVTFIHLHSLDFGPLTRTVLDANQIWVDLRCYAISAFTALYQALAAHYKRTLAHSHTPLVLTYCSLSGLCLRGK